MARKRLILPAIYPVPHALCVALRHIRAKELVVHIHIEVKRKRGVFSHNFCVKINIKGRD
jgi:hypothetical protein